MRPGEIIGRTASVSIRYEIISDWDVYTIPYSLHTLFISVLKSYHIHHGLCVNVRQMRYENISDSNESDTV